MPVRNIAFVIGAGASKEAGLPVGAELKNSIAAALRAPYYGGLGVRMDSGDDMIVEALHLAVAAEAPAARDITPYVHAARRICNAMPLAISIDNYIDAHRGDAKIELCGKLAIVSTILAAEKASLLYISSVTHDNTINYGRLDGTWFNTFFQLLTENSTLSNLKERLSSIALVIFNYDRCVEHYLYHALQNYYPLSANDAALLFQSLEIYHPYGTVGALPWHSRTDAVDFGATLDANELLNLRGRIKTFTEGTDPASSEVTAIQANTRASSTLVFLGFAFHPMNLDLLMPLPKESSGETATERKVFATAVGIYE
ncbi:MAG: hypothetical protein M3461_06240 [Pseudomonadota bacterium]|nr:hypothetical protein [Pseudomonadota bacterium]